MINSFGSLNNLCAKQKQNFIKQRYDEIYAHELAHKQAAGSFGGSIVIEKDGNGIPVGGHVAIKMPGLNPADPEKTIQHADTVIRAALAPSDPSSQDLKVASEARNIKSKALSLKSTNPNVGNKLNYIA